jgi:hypothetical protein
MPLRAAEAAEAAEEAAISSAANSSTAPASSASRQGGNARDRIITLFFWLKEVIEMN